VKTGGVEPKGEKKDRKIKRSRGRENKKVRLKNNLLRVSDISKLLS
jgi:hypothetical protein